MVFWYAIELGSSVAAIAAAEPMAYVQTTPESIIQAVLRARSGVFTGSISP